MTFAKSSSSTDPITEANGGYLLVYDGTRPATADTAVTTQNLVAKLKFQATAFTGSAPVYTASPLRGAVLSAHAPTWARMVRSDGTTRIGDLDAGDAGSNKDLQLCDATGALGTPVVGRAVKIAGFSLISATSRNTATYPTASVNIIWAGNSITAGSHCAAGLDPPTILGSLLTALGMTWTVAGKGHSGYNFVVGALSLANVVAADVNTPFAASTAARDVFIVNESINTLTIPETPAQTFADAKTYIGTDATGYDEVRFLTCQSFVAAGATQSDIDTLNALYAGSWGLAINPRIIDVAANRYIGENPVDTVTAGSPFGAPWWYDSQHQWNAGALLMAWLVACDLMRTAYA